MRPVRGLTLTPEQAEGVRLWRNFVQERRRAGQLRRYCAQVDRDLPNLDPETRADMADALFRQHMSDAKKASIARGDPR